MHTPAIRITAMGTCMRTDNQVSPGLAELRLMQLISPTLPIGAFTYSQGLEWAVESGLVGNQSAVADWLTGQIHEGLTYLELPILVRLYNAITSDDEGLVRYWNDYLMASRETYELREEERNRGRALSRLLIDLDLSQVQRYAQTMQITQVAGFALAAVAWEIPLQQAALGYAWSWLENQVAAAIKLVPLGQTSGQQLQLQLSAHIPPAVELALAIPDDEVGASAPMLAIASSLHETQYTRLFRS